MQYELVEPGFTTEDEAWRHASGYANLIRTTGAFVDGWMVTVRQVAAADTTTGSASWGIYAVRAVDDPPTDSKTV